MELERKSYGFGPRANRRALGHHATAARLVLVLLLPTLALAADGQERISGQVTLAGKPIVGATIILSGAGSSIADDWPVANEAVRASVLHCLTDGAGRFRFDGIDREYSYGLHVKYPGVVPYVRHIGLLLPPYHVDVQASLEVAAIVRGRVTDEKGAPVAAATVRISAQTYSPNPRTRTNADGQFELDQVPKGSYWLEAYTNDGRMGSMQLAVDHATAITQNLTLLPPEDPRTLRVRVTDEVGRPIAGRDIDYADGPERKTDADGRWRSQRYQPGTWVSPELGLGSRSKPLGRIQMPVGKEVVFTVPAGVIEVKPAGGVELVVDGPSYDRLGGSATRYEWLNAGRYSIWAHHPDHRMGYVEVELAPSDVQVIEPPTNSPGRVLRGRFLDKKGRPLARVDVRTSCWDLPFAVNPDGIRQVTTRQLGQSRTETNEQGRFELSGLHLGRHVIFFGEVPDISGRTTGNGVSRLLSAVVPDGQPTIPVDIGDVVPSDEVWSASSHGFVFTTAEGIEVKEPRQYRRRLRRTRDLNPGDLLVAIDGQSLEGTYEWQAMALLDAPGPHDITVRGPHQQRRVVCPPGNATAHLPLRRGVLPEGPVVEATFLVQPLPAGHPWRGCVEPDDILSLVEIDDGSKVASGISRRTDLDLVDQALRSGRRAILTVLRRGAVRHVMYPAH